MINESTIFVFLDSKFKNNTWKIYTEIKNDSGLSAMIFRIHEMNKNCVMSAIHYLETHKTYYKVEFEILYELKNWFGVSLYEGEVIFVKWFKEKNTNFI